MASLPKSKSLVRTQAAALNADAKARDRAAKPKTKAATLDSFVNFAQNMGIGADNPMTSASYGFNPITRNRTILEWIHRGSWLGGVAVDIVADDMTRAGVDIRGGMAPEDIERVEELITGLGVWNSVNESIKWSRLYGGSLAVLLIDGQDMETPLRINTIRKDQFRGILPLDRWMVEPSMSDLITELGPNLGLPKYYTVTATAPGLSRMRIHHSRCIRLEGIRLPYWQRLMENLWGLSVLERLYDRMIAFDSATTGAAQLVYKSYIRTYKIDGMRDIVAAGGDALAGLTRYTDMMRRFQGIEGITLMDKNDEFETASHGGFSGLAEALTQFGQQLSGALQMPLVRLFGQSPSGFNSGDSDMRNYYDSISQQQTKDLLVGITKVYRIASLSLGISPPSGMKIAFKSLWQLDDTEKSNIAANVATAVGTAERDGLIDRPTALRELRQSSTITGVFTNITDEMIKQAEMEPPPPPEGMNELIGEGVPAPAGGVFHQKTGSLEQHHPGQAEQHNLVAKDAAYRPSAGVIYHAGGKVLLLRRGAKSDHSGTWGLPAGRLEAGESTEAAARRETAEEVGFHYDGPLQVVSHGQNFTTYYASIAKPFPVVLDPESTDYRWVDPKEIADQLHPNLQSVLTEMGML